MTILHWTTSTGKKLLVLRFHLTNGSEQEETIDLLNTNSRYIITVNDSIRANALTTMLPNDMSTYAETLEPGQSQELVLLLENKRRYGRCCTDDSTSS